MIVYCHDCEHTFVEHPTETEADLMVCPFCEDGNLDFYPESEENQSGIEDPQAQAVALHAHVDGSADRG